ncbi:hypothetical protein [Ornithobacterium rhinotracheale]|uniref:hypothetical protein n=1 Tax=Ornithobacterium rhinotracheale TaxID=28251 RepID=UPI00129C9738|nr:hypothetical protein [Ornithobacterium rhinotracheale]MRI64655.1 hypothetical protein [Ornithobacterium rhinotracheale]
MAGLNQEIWTDVLVREFRATEEASFLKEIPDESRLVSATRGENQVIHLVDVGADPEVLINNTTYPVGFAQQTDKDIPVQLDSYKTKATKVTDDEIQFIAYDKIKLVQEKHKNAIMRVKHNKALHALTPQTNKDKTPILKTTGEDDGAGRKKMTIMDILKLKRAFDAQKIPADKRVLVLCSDHYNDLLEDAVGKTAFSGQFSDEVGGLLNGRLYGFKVYWYVDAPYITVSSLTKKSFGAEAESGDYQASVAFYAPDMFRASGMTKNYTDEPGTQQQAWFYNVRHNYIVLPRKERAYAAIVSDNA